MPNRDWHFDDSAVMPGIALLFGTVVAWHDVCVAEVESMTIHDLVSLWTRDYCMDFSATNRDT
jgi:hypothetical protein